MKIKFPYKTSRDYRRLMNLLDAGNEIVCVVDYQSGSGITTRDICRGRKMGEGEYATYSFSVRGIGYAETWKGMVDDFIFICRSVNLEFIDPGNNQNVS